MSYCRWSCLNGYSDLYVYEDVSGGWTTHVAWRMLPPGAPDHGMDLLIGKGGSVGKYMEAQKAWDAWKEKVELTDIDHPEAGESFNHPTPGECADNLERLRGEGFVVPDWAVENLRDEHREHVQQREG